MKQEKYSELTDEELLQRAKTMKKTKIYDAVIFGFLVGIAIFSTVKNGIGLFTLLPLIYPPVAANNKKKREELGRLLKERNLEY